MASSARIKMPELQFGFIPGWGGTQRLPRIVGKSKAFEMYMTADTYGAAELLACGLVNKLAAWEEVLSEAEILAKKIIKSSPEAVSEIIRIINKTQNMHLYEGLQVENEGVIKTVNSLETFQRASRVFPKLKDIPRITF